MPSVHELDVTFRASRRVCRIRVGSGALDRLVADLAAEPPGRLLVVVSDSNVAPLHAEPLARRLRDIAGLRVETLTFPAGERHKSRETKAALEDRLAELGAGRDTALVAVGGGVTGDLAGFVAATWNRGVPLVQVPTTVVAMVDAAVGGKTAVNLGRVKNRIGAFHQPWGVYADVALLDTLPAAEYRDGLSEVVKSAVIGDVALFRWLERTHPALAAREPEAETAAVAGALSVKTRVVARDERETGRRAVLNFGHTVAHAIEAASEYGVSHGRAVAIGMSVEGELARGATGFPEAHLRRLRALLVALGLPVALDRGIDAAALLRAARGDKKNRGGELRFALPSRLGRMATRDGTTVALEERALSAAFERAGVD